MSEQLEVIDEQGNVVGIETREKIHREGLLHREVNIWFYTPAGEIVFQRRGPHKDTYPNLLDSTAGGHLDIGDTFVAAALREIEEETGLKLNPADLTVLGHRRVRVTDPVTGNTNHADKEIYAYLFSGNVADLRIEDGNAAGFEAYPITELLRLRPGDRPEFIPSIFSDQMLEIFRKIQSMM